METQNWVFEHLLEYNQKFNCGEKTLKNILSLKDKTACVIATGQQPGPFLGPLYTIYKTVTAIILADNLTKKTSKKFVPIFWIESSDSNISNISSFFYINSENKLKNSTFPLPKEKAGASFAKITLNHHDVNKFILQIKEDLDGEKKDEIFDLITLKLAKYPNLADWFASCLTWLFSSYGLVIIDPQQPELQKLSQPIFKKEIENPLKSYHFIQKDGNLPLFPNNTLLFLKENNLRKKLKFFEPYFQTDSSKFSRDELRSLLNKNPELFSPNVALRPILQDWLLKTSIYVSGPNETAYLAQLKELYKYFDVQIPSIFPRYGATIIPDFIAGLMSQSNLSVPDFKNRTDKKIQRHLRQNPALKQVFNYLFPQQVLQERRLNIVQFLVKYGFRFIDKLFETFSPGNQAELQNMEGKHFIVYTE
ncbi:MAG: bacillithiol biosynthesis cysteine-adding enzyme BshC [bacterium]